MFYLALTHSNHCAISIKVSGDAKTAEAEDGSFLEVTVQNHLPCVSGIPSDRYMAN